MEPPETDDIDRTILHALRADARHKNADISDRLGVSPSTVSKRIARLESEGTIRGYHADIDYERTGAQLNILFICTAAIAERDALVTATFDIDGVVNVRELMTGHDNVHIQAVGSSKADITRIAHSLDELGYTVTDEILLRTEYHLSPEKTTPG